MSARYLATLVFLTVTLSSFSFTEGNKDGHEQLVVMYKKWRAFEQPPLKNGAPDYTKVTFIS